MDGQYAYDAAIARLGEALTFGINPSLDGIRALTSALGDPQAAYRCVQVTGTNGKTSVTRLAGALLAAAGHRTGVYTSPHLVDYTERFEIDGEPVSRDDLSRALAAVYDAADALGGTFTEFELLTAAALWLFRDLGVTWAVLEVGMGGRWDATSVVSPAVSVVTGVALDHTERLGSTREAIASDKAHVIKRGSHAVIGPGCDGVEDILLVRAEAVGAADVTRVGLAASDDVSWRIVERPAAPGGRLALEVTGTGHYRLALRAPSYQAPNVATAVAAAEAALGGPLDPTAVEAACEAVRFPGRFELLREEPPLVIDGAHNPDAATVLASAIAEAFGQTRPAVVLGILADKDAEGIVRALAPVAGRFIVTESASARALRATALGEVVERVTGEKPHVEPVLARAVESATASAGGAVVTGSLYTVGQVRTGILL